MNISWILHEYFINVKNIAKKFLKKFLILNFLVKFAIEKTRENLCLTLHG